MTTPSEPRAEDVRSDDPETPTGPTEQAELDLAAPDSESVGQGAEPTTEDSPGELPDESMGPP